MGLDKWPGLTPILGGMGAPRLSLPRWESMRFPSTTVKPKNGPEADQSMRPIALPQSISSWALSARISAWTSTIRSKNLPCLGVPPRWRSFPGDFVSFFPDKRGLASSSHNRRYPNHRSEASAPTTGGGAARFAPDYGRRHDQSACEWSPSLGSSASLHVAQTQGERA